MTRLIDADQLLDNLDRRLHNAETVAKITNPPDHAYGQIDALETTINHINDTLNHPTPPNPFPGPNWADTQHTWDLDRTDDNITWTEMACWILVAAAAAPIITAWKIRDHLDLHYPNRPHLRRQR